MPDFKSTDVDSGQVSVTAVSIDDYINELQSIHNKIKSGIVPNLTPYWQGPAKENFDQRITFFAVELSNLISEYKELNEQIKMAGTAYGKADDSVIQIIAKLPK